MMGFPNIGADVVITRCLNPESERNHVYMARRKAKRVVVKIFAEKTDFDTQLRALQLLQNLGAPPLIGIVSAKLAIVMEYIDASSLLDLWRSAHYEPLNMGLVWQIGSQLCQLLATWRTLGVAHGDLKATHILPDASCGKLILLDMEHCGNPRNPAYNLDRRLPRKYREHVSTLGARDYYALLQILDGGCALAQNLVNYAQLCHSYSFSYAHSQRPQLLKLAEMPEAWNELGDYCKQMVRQHA